MAQRQRGSTTLGDIIKFYFLSARQAKFEYNPRLKIIPIPGLFLAARRMIMHKNEIPSKIPFEPSGGAADI